MARDMGDDSVVENTVTGPVNFTFQSFAEANDYYIDHNFPDWREGLKTYVIPPVYKIHNEEVPCEEGTYLIPSRKDVEVDDR